MKNLASLIFLLFFLSCGSSKQETPLEFVENFTSGMKTNNQKDIASFFVNTKSDIRKMLLIRMGNEGYSLSDIPDSQVNEMHKAVNEDLPRMLRKVKSKTLKDWTVLELDSVEKQDLTINENQLTLPKGNRAGVIIAHYLINNEPYKIRFQALDLGNGKWKLVDYPRHFE